MGASVHGSGRGGRLSVAAISLLLSSLLVPAPAGALATSGTSDTGWSEAAQVAVPGSSGDTLVAASTTEGGVLALRSSNGAPVGTFGDGGIVKLPVSSDLRMAYDSSSSTGPIVVAGMSAGYLMIHRYSSTGTPDTTFDNDGALRVDVESGDTWMLGGIAVATGGVIQVAGAFYGPSDRGIRLVRVVGASPTLADLTVPGIEESRVNDVAIDGAGQAVVVGYVRAPNQRYGEAFAARFTTAPAPDTTFGGDGFAVTPFGRGHSEAFAVSIPTGSAIAHVAGYSENSRRSAHVARLTGQGALDPGYGAGGVATIRASRDDVARDLYVDSGGNAFVTGRSMVGRKGTTYDLLLAKLGSGGAPDGAFGGGDGVVTTPVGPGDDLGRTLAPDLSGTTLKLVVGGVTRAAGAGFGGDVALARYDATGNVDTGFGPSGTGTALVVLGKAAESATGVVEVAGDPIVTGVSQRSTSMQLYAARFGSPIDDVLVPPPSGLEWRFAGGAARQALGGGNTYVVMVATVSGNGDDFAVVRLNASSVTLDTGFGDAGDSGYQVIDIGTVTPTRTTNDFAGAVAVDGSGRIVVGGRSGSALSIVRLNADGTLDLSFSGDGKLTLDPTRGYDYVKGIAFASNGDIVLASQTEDTNWDAVVSRVSSAGALVSEDRVDVDGAGRQDVVAGVVMVNNDIFVAMTTYTGTADGTQFALLRWNAGTWTTAAVDGFGGGYADQAAGVAVASGKVYVAGETAGGRGSDIVVLRYTSTGAVDTSYGGGNGYVTYEPPIGSARVAGLALGTQVLVGGDTGGDLMAHGL